MPLPINTDPARAGLSRRALVRSSSVGAVGLAAGVIVTGKPTLADPSRYNADAMAAQISNKLFADDGLARPVPDKPTISELARGLDRTLVLVAAVNTMSLGIVGSFTVCTGKAAACCERGY
jgi:hypothetical protein